MAMAPVPGPDWRRLRPIPVRLLGPRFAIEPFPVADPCAPRTSSTRAVSPNTHDPNFTLPPRHPTKDEQIHRSVRHVDDLAHPRPASVPVLDECARLNAGPP